MTNGSGYCWGGNSSGQLGDGTTNVRLSPVSVSGGLAFATLSAGGQHTCGVTTDHTAYCWGNNDYGQLGDGSTTSGGGSLSTGWTPVAVSGGLAFESVSAGGEFTCGTTTGGKAYCWGHNDSGQLGTGDSVDSSMPVAVAGGLAFSSVSAGSVFACGVTTNDQAYCWGSNASGGLGTGNTASQPLPAAVRGGLSFGAVSAGGWYACGLTRGGAAYCWGANSQGQLGDGDTASSSSPVAVSTSAEWVGLDAGFDHGCGVAPRGATVCWGNNESGQLGAPSGWCGGKIGSSSFTFLCSRVPIRVAGALAFAAISGGSTHTCGVTTNGAAYCWGANFDGQLGNNSTTDSQTPVLVGP